MQGLHNYRILGDLLGDGIFTVDGEKWRQQRKVSSYEFSTKVLRDFSSIVFRKNVAKLAKIISEAAASNQIMDIQVSFHNLPVEYGNVYVFTSGNNRGNPTFQETSNTCLRIFENCCHTKMGRI